MSICTNCIHKNVCDYESRYREECSQFLEERPHGEWIPVTDLDGRISVYKCKDCGWLKYNKMAFCENCGADMKKEGEEK